MERSSTVLDDCEPDPFAVATWMEKSFSTGPRVAAVRSVPGVVEICVPAIPDPLRPSPDGR
jgi:hypothetical protein